MQHLYIWYVKCALIYINIIQSLFFSHICALPRQGAFLALSWWCSSPWLKPQQTTTNIMRIWEPQAGAHKNIFQKIIILIIIKIISKISPAWTAVFVDYHRNFHRKITVTRIIGHGDELTELQRPFSGSAKMLQLRQSRQNPDSLWQKTRFSFFLFFFSFFLIVLCFFVFVFFFDLFSTKKTFSNYFRIAKSIFNLFSFFLEWDMQFFWFYSDLKHLLSLFSSLPVRLPQSSLRPWLKVTFWNIPWR